MPPTQLFFGISLIVIAIIWFIKKDSMNVPVFLSKKELDHHFMIVTYEGDVFVFKDLDSREHRLFHPPAGCKIDLLPQDERYICQIGTSGTLTMKMESWEKDAQH